MLLQLATLYLVIINLVSFFLFGLDKRKSRRNAWRIPEATLFIVSALGGSIGALCGMYIFRHKTKHASFVYGIPAILLGEVFLIALIMYLI